MSQPPPIVLHGHPMSHPCRAVQEALNIKRLERMLDGRPGAALAHRWSATWDGHVGAGASPASWLPAP